MLVAKVNLDGAGRVTVDGRYAPIPGAPAGRAADAPSLRTMPSGAVSLTGDLWINRGKLRLDTDQQLVFADGDMSSNLKLSCGTATALASTPARCSTPPMVGMSGAIATANTHACS